MSFLNNIAGAVDVGSNIASSASSLGSFGWNMYAQKKTWEREDQAVQRRVNDLRQAGLSPTLAAGSSAQTSAPIKQTGMEKTTDLQNKALNAGALIQQEKNIAKTESEQKLIDLQYQKALRDFQIIKGEQPGLRSDDNSAVAKAFNAVNAVLGLGTNKGLNEVTRDAGNVLKSAGSSLVTKMSNFNNDTKNIDKLSRNTPKEPVMSKSNKDIVNKYKNYGKTNTSYNSNKMSNKDIVNKWSSYGKR